MEIKQLERGTKVDMRVAGSTDENDHYISSIVDVLYDGTLDLSIPMRAGKMVLVPTGVRYELIFTLEENNRMMKFDVKLLRRVRRGRISVFIAQPVSPIEKFQRREYYRLNVNLPMTYFPLTADIGELKSMAEIRDVLQRKIDSLKQYEATIVNISGGGMKCISDYELSDDETHVFMRFSITSARDAKTRVIALAGKVVGRDRNEDDGGYAYRIKILFKDSRLQEQIIRFIFEQERIARRKELGT